MGAQNQQFVQYHFEHSRSFLKYLIVPKSHNSIPLDSDTRITEGITSNLLLMLTTIKLDYKLRVHARKIRYVTLYRYLAAKSKTVQLPPPQVPPQQSLGISGMIA